MTVGKIEDLQTYLNEVKKMTVITLEFKDLYKFDKEILQNLNKFHDENQKIIGTIETILESKKVDKYCVDKHIWEPPLYPNFPNEKFSRVRSFSDHPRPFTENLFNTSKIEEMSEPPTAEAKENLNNGSVFDETLIPKFPDLKQDNDIKKEILQKPAPTIYTSLIPIKSNMFYRHLDRDFKEFINNPEDFENIKFYYYKNAKSYDSEKLYVVKKPTANYYIADNKKLYMLDEKSNLVPAHYESRMQHWKEKLI